MSDLQCAATLLIVRHAEAEYDDELLSDRGGSLSLRGRERARALADSLAGERVSMIYSSGMSRAVQTAEIVAARLGVAVRVRDDLREFSVGEYAGQPYVSGMFDATFSAWQRGDLAVPVPGGESGQAVLDRMAGELDGIVDQHRGETVLVVTHGGVISLAVPHLAVNVGTDFATGRDLENCGLVRVLADADGFVVRGWGGEPLGANRGKMRDSDGVL
jgi:probable phosphoglycerate mutase